VFRWFSPGVDLGAGQIIAELSQTLRLAKRQGTPIERIVLDGVELAEDNLPTLRGETMFWPTVVEFVRSEPVSSFFVFEGDPDGSPSGRLLAASADFHLDIKLDAVSTRASRRRSIARVDVKRVSGQWATGDHGTAELRIAPNGDVL
jgi:hypothetical protein